MKKIEIGTRTGLIPLDELVEKRGKPVYLDVEVFLRTRALVQAASGQGKSHLLRRIIELLLKVVQVFVIDHEGDFSTLRPKFDFALIGEGGDAIPDVRTASLLAQRLLELETSTVFDLSEAFRAHPSHRRAWVKNFLHGMMEAPRRLWHPVIVVVDEAHKYCPEKDEAESSEAMTSVATDGRKRQFCALWATQRLAKLNKDAAAELLNVFIGGTTLDVDRKRAADALGVYGRDLQPFNDAIKVVERGNFYVLGPAIAKSRELVLVGPTETKPPAVGARASRPAAPPPNIKALLPKLADLPKEQARKEQTEADYQKRIGELERELRQTRSLKGEAEKMATTAVSATRRPVTIDELAAAVKPILEHDRKMRDAAYVSAFRKALADAVRSSSVAIGATTLGTFDDQVVPRAVFTSAIQSLNSKTAGAGVGTTSLGGKHNDGVKTEARGVAISAPAKYLAPKPAFVRMSTELLRDLADGEGKPLKSGAREILAIVARAGAPVDKEALGVMIGASVRTLTDYLSALRGRGLIEDSGSSAVQITADGVDAAAGLSFPTKTPDQVLERWLPKFKAGAGRMLQVLVEHYPSPMTRDELQAAAGIPAERTTTDYLSVLRRARLLDESGGRIGVSKHLF